MILSIPRRLVLVLGAGLVLMIARPGAALVFSGVNEAALDQPRINAAITLPGSPDTPLTATVDDLIFGGTTQTFNIQAFFDTGASGVLMSKETAEALGVPLAEGVEFGDVGVGGISFFDVSEDVMVRLAPFTPTADVDNPDTFTSTYDQVFGPLRMQVAQTNASFLTGPLDVFGMPVFQGKTVVMDTRPVGQIAGTINTTVHDSADNAAFIPPAHLTIPTTDADFAPFTTVTPDGAQGPTLNDNPFIGPDPTAALGASSQANHTPGVKTFDDDQLVEGSWLFDTGAAASIISSDTAAGHHVRYVPGTEGTENPQLERFDPADPDAPGTPLAEQFTLQVGGVGGVTTKAGFFLESLTLPTVEGEPITFTDAPALVADIELQDPDTLEKLTLDGILGMNYFAGSASLDFSAINASAFDFFSFDQPTGAIGLTFNPALLDTAGYLDAMASGWQQPTDAGWDGGDLNGDGVVDEFDLARLAVMWPQGQSTTFAEAVAAAGFVPEPGTAAVLVGLGGVWASYRPRRRRRPNDRYNPHRVGPPPRGAWSRADPKKSWTAPKHGIH